MMSSRNVGRASALWLLLRVVDTFTTSYLPPDNRSPPQICRAAAADFPSRTCKFPGRLDPSTHAAPEGQLVPSAGVRAHVGSFRVTERGEMETLGAAP